MQKIGNILKEEKLIEHGGHEEISYKWTRYLVYDSSGLFIRVLFFNAAFLPCKITW